MKAKIDLAELAAQFMREKGLEPEFPKEAVKQVSEINQPAPASPRFEDLRSLKWCSIDNDDSKDLDQLTYGEKNGDQFTLWIAVADVDALVDKDTPIDVHAKVNTTSVYTPARIFSMLPEKLSTNLTSLNENEDRLAMVTKIAIDAQGNVISSEIFRGIVRNHAKLAYNALGAWLEGINGIPEKAKGFENELRVQHEAAQILRQKRHWGGSLTLESPKSEVKVRDDDQIMITLPPHNFAHQLIEEFMIAANRAMVHHCKEGSVPSLRRVVRIPKYWDRIVDVAREYGFTLPEVPDSKALDEFLLSRQKADPVSFPDLSLIIIKLLGRGEYVVENDQQKPIGHFGLALTDYTHSTAPNRRYPDLITQRQYKAFLQRISGPYTIEELRKLAEHCTQQEDAATKVERQAAKSAAALYLSDEIGSTYKGIITGSSDQGTWVRLFEPAVEGKIIRGGEKTKVGDRVTVQLKFVDVAKGYIDFVMR